MSAARLALVAAVGALVWPCAGCSQEGGDARSAIDVRIAPLGLEGVVEAGYHLVAKNALGVVAWEDDVTATVDASGASDVDYTGPCVAADGPYRIELTLSWLRDERGRWDPSMYLDPTATAPLVVQTACPESGHVAVAFDVKILGIQRGFETDVHLEDIFCSAKFDCTGDDGGPLLLLSDPTTDERAPTVVLAFACTAGKGQATTLYLNDVYVSCQDGHRYWIDPSAGSDAKGGQLGAQRPLFFERATYRGREQLPGLDECYWNVALGLSLPAESGRCHLEATGTAGTLPLSSDRDPNALTLYPVMRWSIDLVGPSGALACTHDPLGGLHSGTTVGYRQLGDSPFQHAMECATTTITTPPRVLCDHGVQPTDDAVSVTSSTNGVYVEVGADKSELYRLPDDMDAPDCCMSPCCSE